MRRMLCLAFAVVLVPALALAQDAKTYSVQGDSTLKYTVVHKLHTVESVSKKVEGKSRILGDGAVQAMVRVRVDSFDSSNDNRDAHMKEIVEAEKFPLIEFKAAGRLTPPAAYPATVEVPLKGAMSFHGVQQPLEAKVKAVFTDASHVTVDGHLDLSLDSFKIDRPSFMFVKLDDKLQVDLHLNLLGDK